MIPAPDGFIYPSELVSMFSVDLYDESGGEVAPYWSAGMRYSYGSAVGLGMSSGDWLEAVFSAAARGGVFAWDLRSDPYLIATDMKPCGSFPNCLIFSATTNVIAPNRSSQLLERLGNSENNRYDIEYFCDAIELSRGQYALFDKAVVADLAGSLRMGRWEDFCRRSRYFHSPESDRYVIFEGKKYDLFCPAEPMDFLDETQPFPVWLSIFGSRLHNMAVGVQKAAAELSKGGQKLSKDEERAKYFDTLSDEKLARMGRKAAWIYVVEYERRNNIPDGVDVSESTARRARDAARKARGLL